MSNSYFSRELERAVFDGDFKNVRALLDRGADVNLKIGMEKGTLLHYTRSVDVTKELLLRGAEVDARNMYGDTPLHSAITQAKGWNLVMELLKHGAGVNAINLKGNTPLHHAIKRSSKNLQVITLLLFYGADINARNCERPRGNFTSLDYAVARNVTCAKLLIKISLIMNFDRGYRKIINLTPYRRLRAYSVLSRYLVDCVCEILRMKTNKVNDNLSLYEFVIMKTISMKTLHAGNKIRNQVILTNYPIYHDIISSKVKFRLQRTILLNMLSELQIYMGSDVKEKEVILNFDCTYNIAKYLSNADLLNLLEVFYKDADQSSDFSENLVESSQRPDTELDEASSASSCADC